MKRTITLAVDVSDGEDVLLVAMLGHPHTISIARKSEKGAFAPAVQALLGGPWGDRPVSCAFGEPKES
jgi:hypothetical protein